MVANTVKNSNFLTWILLGLVGLLGLVILYLIFWGNPALLMDRIAPGTIIVRQIHNVSELTTAIFEMETVVPVNEKGFLSLTESKLLYVAHGNVRVGVNLNEFDSDNVQVEDDKITVTLPPIKVIDSKLDLQHSSVYSYDRGFLGLGPDVVNLQARAQQEAQRKIEKSVCQDWLIKIANERVQKTVEQLLERTIKNKQIIVKTQPYSENFGLFRTCHATNSSTLY